MVHLTLVAAEGPWVCGSMSDSYLQLSALLVVTGLQLRAWFGETGGRHTHKKEGDGR